MSLSYRQVKDLYDQLHSSGATNFSLPEWSQRMNEATGTDLYTQGQSDNFVKRSSVAIDKALEWSGIPSATREFGRSAGALVGNPEAGAAIGEGLPRMAVNFLPLVASAAFPPAAPYALAMTGALSGSEAYTKTGSPASGLVTAGINMALPGVANAAEQAVLRRMGVESLGPIASRFAQDASGNITELATKPAALEASTLAQHLASFGGGQAAAAGLMEGQRWGEEGFRGEPLHNPFSTENLLNYTLGQLPFMGIHAISKAAGLGGNTREAVARTESLLEQKRAQDALAEQPDISKIAPVVPAWTAEQISKLVENTNSLRQQQDAITSKPTMLPEDAEKLNALTQADLAAPRVTTATSALGAEQGAENVPVIGKQIHETAKWRKILVSNDESNPPELRGQVVEYSKGLREPAPTPIEGTDQHTFGVTTDPLWRTIKTVEDEANRQLDYAKACASVTRESGTVTPELPEQSSPATDYFAHITDLDRIEGELADAKTPAARQKVVLALRALQERAGKEPSNDMQLARIEAKLAKLNPKVDSNEAALKSEASKLRRQLDAEERNYAREVYRQQHGDIAPNTGENLGKVNRGKNINLPKLSDDTEAIHNFIDEVTSGVQAEKDASDSFAQWQKSATSKDVTSLPLEKERFKIWYRMRQSGEIGTEEQMTPTDVKVLNDELRAEGIGVDNVEVLRDFPERDHVMNWNDAVNERLVEGMSHAPQPTSGGQSNLSASVQKNIADAKMMSPNDPTGFLRKMADAARKQGNEEGAKNFEDALNALAPKQISAGGDFVWGLANYDPTTNKLAGKHTLPKSAELTEAQFLAMSGRGKPLNRAEFETAKLLVPEAFDAHGNVNVRKLYELLSQRQPVTNVSYGQEGKVSEAKAELDKMIHEWADNLPATIENNILSETNQDLLVKMLGDDDPWKVKIQTPEFQAQAKKYRELHAKVASEPPDSSPRATSYYNQISAFPKGQKWTWNGQEFTSDPFRVDVALPETKVAGAEVVDEKGHVYATYQGEKASELAAKWIEHNKELEQIGDRKYSNLTVRQKAVGDFDKVLWPPDNLHENLPNTLGWAMVQFVPDPKTGETVAFVGEQQSRWGQSQRQDREAHIREFGIAPEVGPPHPLLPIQHSLVLKAVIAEAAKRGVTKVVVSDGVSAMMTEGHDKQSHVAVDATEANAKVLNKHDISYQEIGNKLSLAVVKGELEDLRSQLSGLDESYILQSGGMHLHYNTTLPSAMKKLTGDEGQEWKGGVHKNAKSQATTDERVDTTQIEQAYLAGDITLEQRNQQEAAMRAQVDARGVVGSPVFRNSDGTPKSLVTGRIYDIGNATSNLEAQGGFTLGDPLRAPRIAEPKRYASEVAAQQEVGTKLTTDGHGLVAELLQDSDPQVVALAKDLQTRFPEALKRIDSGIYDVAGSYAARRPSGRVGIFFDRGMLTSLPFVRNNIALHELIHGLTLHELANPRVDPKVIAELTALRERLVEALPKELKAKFDEAINSEWYDRYVNNATDMNELHPDPNKAQILYGLLRNDELAAQAFSSHDMRKFMQSVKGTKSNGWQGFTRWVKSLLGVGGTAFDDFLSTISQLLNNGEYLSDFANFGERYFEGRGESASYARGQTDRALGLITGSAHGLNEPLTLASQLDLSGSKSEAPLELRKARRDYDNLLRNSEEDRAHVEGVLAELGHKDIDEMVTSAIGEGSDISQALDLLPPEATSYVYAKLKDTHDVLDVIRAASSAENKGMLNLANPKLLAKSVAPVLRNVKRALAHEEFATQMATSLAGLGTLTPEGLMNALPSMAPKTLEPTLNPIEDKSPDWFEGFMRQWEPPPQVARRIPEIAEIISKGRQLASNIRRTAHESLKWWAMDTSNPNVDVLTQESEQHSERVMVQPKLRDGVGEYIHLNQVKGKEAGATTILPENDSDVAKLKAKFTEDQWKDVLEGVNKHSKSLQDMQQRKIGILTGLEVKNAANRLQFATGLKTKDNITIAATMLDGIQKQADPMTAQEGVMLIQSAQQRLADPTIAIDLYKFLQISAQQIKIQKDYYDANPAWSTAQRMEQFVFNGLKNGKSETLQASSRLEAEDTLKKGGYKLIGEIKDQWAGREDSPWQMQNLPPEMIARMRELNDNQFAILAKDSNITRDQFDRSSSVSQMLREAGAGGAIPRDEMPARQLSKGADKLPWLYNHIAWLQRESAYWNRLQLRSEKDLYLRDVELRDRPDLQEYVDTHIESMLRPDPAFAKQANRFVASWFLPYNLAMHIINGFQPYVTHISELMAVNDGKAIDSYQRILRAHKEAIDLKFGDRRWASPEHEWLHGKAVKDGQIGPHKFDDDAAAQETRAYRFMRLLKKEAPKTLGQRLGQAADAYTTVGMWTFKGPEQLNAETALFASYDLYREQGLSKEDAKQKAYEFNGVTNFNEGRNQRGVGLFSSKSPTLRGAAMLGTGLQSYVLGTTAQIIRYVRSGFFRPAGITPAESFAAKRAAVQMLATQFALAGTLGMPFVSGALALLNSAFPDLEVNKNLREWMNKFMSSDEANGNVLTDIAMTGVPSMMGWDMQGRLSLGNTLPGVSEVNGFQPENLLGPSANIVRNFINGTTGWAKGEASAGFKFLPPALAKLIQAGQASLSSGQAGGGIRDYAGRPLASPTPGEYTGSLLGFQPKRLSDQNAAARMLKQSEEVLRTQESRFRQQQAEEVLKGNFGTVRQELATKKREQKDYNDVAAVQSISQAAEALAFPRDLRREGTKLGARGRGAFLQTFGDLGQVGASEVQRLQFRKQIEQRLGLVGDSRQEQKLAILMDQMKAQMPEATRLEIKSAATEAMRRSQSRELQEVE